MLNLSKYDNADRNTLTSAYNSLEKKQAKLLEQVRENEVVLKFLSEKIANAFKRNNEQYYTLETSPAIKKINKWEQENPQEAEQIKAELKEEMGY